MYAEVDKIYDKNKSSILEIVKKEKEICASFAIAHQTTKVIAIHDKHIQNRSRSTDRSRSIDRKYTWLPNENDMGEG